MLIGERIKKIRIFRGMTQKELGIAIGLDEKTADVRIAQYESNNRIPKMILRIKLSSVLKVSPLNFYVKKSGSAEDVILTFFWMEENNPDSIHLFRFAEQTESSQNFDGQSGHAPIGICFTDDLISATLHEWLLLKQKLKTGKISQNDYFEWKLNWTPCLLNTFDLF